MTEPSRYVSITDFNAVEAHFKRALYQGRDTGDAGFRRPLEEYRRKFPRGSPKRSPGNLGSLLSEKFANSRQR